MRAKILFFFIIVSFVSSCFQRGDEVTFKSQNEQLYMVGATLWYQRAAELKALSYQAFNIARLQLDLDLQFNEEPSERAIIVDIDETILDNSAYQAHVVLSGKGFDPQTWEQWVDLAQASALPGAVEFINYAHSQGVEVFYITNRYERGREKTIKNLALWGLPVKSENLLMRVDEHSKKQRRQQVKDQYRVVLLMGDQLEDFSHRFDDVDLAERDEVTEFYRDQFGHRFIILPNPMYGMWERLFYQDQTQKQSRWQVWSDLLMPFAD